MVMEMEYPNPLDKNKPMTSLSKKVYFQHTPEALVQQALDLEQGTLNDAGALCITTGKFTGRSPKDRFIVKDESTVTTVDWGDVNIAIAPEVFDRLLQKMTAFVEEKELWVRACYAGADPQYRINVTVINTTPWANLFCHHLFISPTEQELINYQQEWLIFQIPEFLADPLVDGTRQENFSIINFSEKIILIGGTAYTGEMKKGIFSVLNFLLPQQDVLPMHCSANEGSNGDVALFFGLSGTGKTTLSADPERKLIGDDEHGWSQETIFNFEGGCYAKCIDLSADKEPQIYAAIRSGSLLENTRFFTGTNRVDYSDSTITENTRAAYPIMYINEAKMPAIGKTPTNIFFLTCDAFGVLPPISKLTTAQAMYHFLSGYTAKVAGTEIGIKEPQTTFSACFGRVFLPANPTAYATLLGKKLEENPNVNVWLVNTGWTGGSYGEGKRISLRYTRALVSAAIQEQLRDVPFVPHPSFLVLVPQSCPNVPASILNPRDTWSDKEAYDRQSDKLTGLFMQNFEAFREQASEEIRQASPKFLRKIK
ncbi:phosphoenolpyruvate carboxykinase (ATP) [Sphingobacterium bambusae]|uniref:Phosphoenolpyruvate carboxykinase (ATP) n=2 Tax=Sphingobacterium bambusae TaxID=662858 RepID=A0ABW6BHG4_9SPHI|nr:phosphoenolpyruvate carboxykinase (ATP) [Sphingobacterium bambusae]WPL50417.1 phosphoenolpyruvate carboxykinase (ATP) [Sphingobacterium bambusae]